MESQRQEHKNVLTFEIFNAYENNTISVEAAKVLGCCLAWKIHLLYTKL
jgi:hypothetical protein